MTTLIHTVTKVDDRRYHHKFTSDSTRFPLTKTFFSFSPKPSKKELRTIRTFLYQGMRPRKIYHPDLCKLGQWYYPKHWAQRKQELKLKRVTVNQAKSILKCSKRDARSRKVRIAQDYSPDQPLWQAKRREHYAKKHQTPMYPDFVTFDVQTEIEECPDYDYLGDLKRNWEPGAINHYAKQYGRDGESRDFNKWYVPPSSYTEERQGLQKRGYSKAESDFLARSYIHSNYDRFASLGSTWDFVTITVTCYIGSFELGCNSCGNCESDIDHSETIEDLKHDVMSNYTTEDLEQIAKDAGLI